MSTTPTMRDKTVVVTGETRGIGYETARGLAALGATVMIVSRDATRGAATVASLKEHTGNTHISFLPADLSSLTEVRRLATQITTLTPQLHVLVNNAGAHVQQREHSADGIEMNPAVNHLSSFLLTNLLLDTMKASSPARLVDVASNAMTKTLDLSDLRSERTFVPFAVYGQAKLAMVMCTYALARRLAGTGVTVNALHPGITATNIVNDVAPPLARPFVGLIKRFLPSPARGARTALYLATSPAVAGVSGKYFIKEKETPSVPISYDEGVQERLWAISTELTALPALPVAARHEAHERHVRL